MKKDPAVLFYSSDFLAFTFHLTDEEVGKVIRLLCMQHIHGRIDECCMPLDNKRILALFERDEEGYYNQRLEEDIEKRERFCQSRKNNKAMGIKHKEKSEAQSEESAPAPEDTVILEEKPQPVSVITKEEGDKIEHSADYYDFWQDVPEQMSKSLDVAEEKSHPVCEFNHSSTPKKESQRAKNARLAADFKRFWNAYPKKVAKAEAERCFNRLSPDTELADAIVSAVEAQKTWDTWKRDSGKYIPHPSTWLNQQRWLDESPAACKVEEPEWRYGTYY